MAGVKAVLKPGEMQLFSYHLPSLQAGNYSLNVKQNLDIVDEEGIPRNKPLKETNRTFRIDAPRFSLPPGDIHSYYPPNGHADLARVLPHIVFNDPHLPWERPMQEKRSDEAPAHMPWLGILAFTSDELQLDSGKLPAIGGWKPSETMAYHMTLGDLLKMRDQVALPFKLEEMDKPDRAVRDPTLQDGVELDVVFFRAELFSRLFCKQQQASDQKIELETSLDRFLYMSHVRRVHTDGMAAASQDDSVGDQDEFSVIVSPRSGPAETLEAPVRMVAHLLSLEGILENMRLQEVPTQDPQPSNGQLPASHTDVQVNGKKWTALVSLDSWSYQSLPASHTQYLHLVEDLRENMQPLSLPDSKIKLYEDLVKDPQAQDVRRAAWLAKRLRLGHSFIKYRPATGEMTTALYHGPLSPIWLKPDSEAKGIDRYPSSNGSDLQIVDDETGLADISYHTAWELGRSLAASDREFAAALMRLRATIHTAAKAAYLAKLVPDGQPFLDATKHREAKAEAVTAALAPDKVAKAHISDELNTIHRWNRHATKKRLDADMAENATDVKLEVFIKEQTAKITAHAEGSASASSVPVAATSDGRSTQGTQQTPNPGPRSSNWKIISQWCVDKLLLNGIPQINLLPEPEFLPEESLRTFYIDEAWMNCLIDGALSVANHGPYNEPDYIRRELKRNLNDKVLNANQIPTWGFIIRSKVVRAFPDLQIRAPLPGDPDDIGDDKPRSSDRDQVVRMLHLAPDTLMCLFDRRPEEEGQFQFGIYIRQPSHQQRFSVGNELTDDAMELILKLLTNKPSGSKSNPQLKIVSHRTGTTEFFEAEDELKPKDTTWTELQKARSWKQLKVEPIMRIYDWETRCLVFPAFASTVYTSATKVLGAQLELKGACPSWTGLQLNDDPLVLHLRPLDMKLVKSKWEKRILPTEIREKSTNSINAISLPVSTGATAGEFKTQDAAIKPLFFAFPRIRQFLPAPPAKLRAARPPEIHVPLAFGLEAAMAPTESFIYKQIYPLGHFGKAIPTRSKAETHDLVFSIQARPAPAAPSPDTVLLSLTVLVPAGREAADLLRVTVLPPPIGADTSTHTAGQPVLAALPRPRIVGKGLRWHAVVREVRKQREAFRHYVLAKPGIGPAAGRRGLPATVLAVKLTPKGDETQPLSKHPELGFVLEGCVLQTLPCSEVDILFVERYGILQNGRLMERSSGKYQIQQVVTRIMVEKQA